MLRLAVSRMIEFFSSILLGSLTVRRARCSRHLEWLITLSKIRFRLIRWSSAFAKQKVADFRIIYVNYSDSAVK